MGGYFNDIKEGIGTALIGMKVTFSHLFVKNVTIQYPDVKHDIPERVRNRLYVNMDDCIGCMQCSKACPVNCIEIETAKAMATEDLGETSTGNKKRLWVTRFDIDFAKCCYCGLCTFPCPTECIFMTEAFEFTEHKREDLIYHYHTLSDAEAAEKIAAAEKEKAEKEAKKAAATAAKKKKAEEAKASEQANAPGAAANAPDEAAKASEQANAPDEAAKASEQANAPDAAANASDESKKTKDETPSGDSPNTSQPES